MLFLLKWDILVFFEILHNFVFEEQKKNFRDSTQVLNSKKKFFFHIFQKITIKKVPCHISIQRITSEILKVKKKSFFSIFTHFYLRSDALDEKVTMDFFACNFSKNIKKNFLWKRNFFIYFLHVKKTFPFCCFSKTEW